MGFYSTELSKERIPMQQRVFRSSAHTNITKEQSQPPTRSAHNRPASQSAHTESTTSLQQAQQKTPHLPIRGLFQKINRQ